MTKPVWGDEKRKIVRSCVLGEAPRPEKTDRDNREGRVRLFALTNQYARDHCVIRGRTRKPLLAAAAIVMGSGGEDGWTCGVKCRSGITLCSLVRLFLSHQAKKNHIACPKLNRRVTASLGVTARLPLRAQGTLTSPPLHSRFPCPSSMRTTILTIPRTRST